MFFLIFLVVFPCFSLKPYDLHFSVEPFFSYSKGSVNEYLYDNDETNRLLSKLEWDRNIFMYGAKSKLKFWRLGLETSIASSIPASCGKMQDSDWMNERVPDMKTTYSVGTNNACENYDASILFSFDFYPFNSPEQEQFIFSVFMQFQYLHDLFERKKAEGWYGQWDHTSDGKNHWWYEDEAAHYPYTYWNEGKGKNVTLKLAGISYEIDTLSIFLGGNFSVRIGEKINIDLGLAFAPFSYTETTDIHHGSERKITGSQQNFWNQFKCSLKSAICLTSRIETTLELSTAYSQISKGSFYIYGEKDRFHNTGSNHFSVTATTGIRFRIF